MRILVFGFYDRDNLGDEMFKETIPKVCGTIHEYTFIEPSKFTGNVHEYDSIICGGGDIINEFFMDPIVKIVSDYNKPIYAFGVGIPFKANIFQGYVELFDHFFVREKEFVPIVQRRIGAQYAHYMPDLAFSIDFKRNFDNKETNKETKKIGIFLAQAFFPYKSIVYKISRFLESLAGDYEIIFYKFNTSGSHCEDDGIINNLVYDMINDGKIGLKITNDENRYTTSEMLQKISELDFSVCFRFHSAIFNTIAGTPFISISSNRKIIKYMNENGLSKYHVNMSLNENWKPQTFDFDETISKFEYMVSNKDKYISKLKRIYNKNSFIVKNGQFSKLLSHNEKRDRIKLPNFCYAENVDIICQKYKKIIHDKTKINLDKDTNIALPLNIAEKISKMLCFEVTEMPSSAYEYGTTINLTKNNYVLRDLISWIAQDCNTKYYQNCNKFYLDYIMQDSFRNLHRSGWQYVIEHIYSLNNPFGVIMDTYVDRTFTWANFEMKQAGIIPYSSPWVGFIHHTFEEKFSENNNATMLRNPDFIISLEMCKGLYVMTHYLKKLWEHEFSKRGIRVPINVIQHPTQFVEKDKMFSIDKYILNNEKKIVNIGAWYRNCFTLYIVPKIKNHKKCYLKGNKMENYFMPLELEIYKDSNIQNCQEFVDLICRCNVKNKWVEFFVEWINKEFYEDIKNLEDNILLFSFKNGGILYEKINKYLKSVKIIDSLSNDDYDDLLVKNVVFLDLVSASACNTIIECIVRNTPILINYIEPVVEVFGENYPLYYKNIEEIPHILTEENVIKASKYISRLDKTNYRIENFIQDLKNSSIYQSL